MAQRQGGQAPQPSDQSLRQNRRRRERRQTRRGDVREDRAVTPCCACPASASGVVTLLISALGNQPIQRVRNQSFRKPGNKSPNHQQRIIIAAAWPGLTQEFMQERY